MQARRREHRNDGRNVGTKLQLQERWCKPRDVGAKPRATMQSRKGINTQPQLQL